MTTVADEIARRRRAALRRHPRWWIAWATWAAVLALRALLRAGEALHQTVWPGDGVYCPGCGRGVRAGASHARDCDYLRLKRAERSSAG